MRIVVALVAFALSFATAKYITARLQTGSEQTALSSQGTPRRAKGSASPHGAEPLAQETDAIPSVLETLSPLQLAFVNETGSIERARWRALLQRAEQAITRLAIRAKDACVSGGSGSRHQKVFLDKSKVLLSVSIKSVSGRVDFLHPRAAALMGTFVPDDFRLCMEQMMEHSAAALSDFQPDPHFPDFDGEHSFVFSLRARETCE